MQTIWAQFAQAEIGFTLRVNRLSHRAGVLALFRVVSRLGDGMAWYGGLAVMLLAGGPRAAGPVLQTGVTALVGVALYRLLKERLVRDRPFITFGDIRCGTAPLDRYSFPSGHTLHAALFCTFFVVYLPALAVLMLPFGLLVAASRVVLGLHYPTDVLAGGALGLALAATSLALQSFPPIVG
ncbi:MAG: phosphatase PAP2 family protein [Gammaproteobacteria bacterium]|jgi:undecaprenyl-diphosphatase